MKLHVIARSLLILESDSFQRVSSLAAQSLRLVMKHRKTDSQHIAAKKFNGYY